VWPQRWRRRDRNGRDNGDNGDNDGGSTANTLDGQTGEATGYELGKRRRPSAVAQHQPRPHEPASFMSPRLSHMLASAVAAVAAVAAASAGSEKQVPQDQRATKGTCRPKHLLRRAPALGRPLELLVAAPDVLRRVERVLHQLLNVRRLHAEVVGQRRLQLRDFRQRLLRRAVHDDVVG